MPRPRFQFRQFRLRTIFELVTVVAIWCWVLSWARPKHEGGLVTLVMAILAIAFAELWVILHKRD